MRYSIQCDIYSPQYIERNTYRDNIEFKIWIFSILMLLVLENNTTLDEVSQTFSKVDHGQKANNLSQTGHQ